MTLTMAIVSGGVPSDRTSMAESTMPTRRKRSDVTIELGQGRRFHVDNDMDTEALGRIHHRMLGLR